MFPYKSSDGIQQYGIVKASYANFGFVPYGHSMVSNGANNYCTGTSIWNPELYFDINIWLIWSIDGETVL